MAIPTKDERIQIRITPEHKEVIDKAAQLIGQNRTDFIVQSAYRVAQETLLDQTVFHLSDSGWDHFIDLLDHPSEPGEALKALMNKKAVWEH
ncbi:MAG: DUF1778 domain-containing protein [Thermosynechococcaceae cyanobacterium]